MSMVHISSGMNKPASPHLLSEPAIIARMAAATLPQSQIAWLWMVEDYDRIRDKIAEVIDGFEDFNARVHVPGGFYLGNSARERAWVTPEGKARFMTHAVPTDLPIKAIRQQHADKLVFNLMTVRSHDQYNTTIYGLDDRYRGVFGHRRVVFINKNDLARLGLVAGQWVDMTSLWQDGERVAREFFAGGIRHPGRLPGQLLPGNQCAGAAKQHGRSRAYARFQISAGGADAQRA